MDCNLGSAALVASRSEAVILPLAVGTFETCPPIPRMSVHRGRPEVVGSGQTDAFDPERKSQNKTVRTSGTDASLRIRGRKCEVPWRPLGRPSHSPEDSVREDSLVAGVLPN
jgi:hypothetical protein